VHAQQQIWWPFLCISSYWMMNGIKDANWQWTQHLSLPKFSKAYWREPKVQVLIYLHLLTQQPNKHPSMTRSPIHLLDISVKERQLVTPRVL
jgi:hypothetical protein